MTEQVTIDRLGHLGDGIAPGPVFVARTLPGEVVSGEPTGDRIIAPKIVTPSANRIAAPCPHYKSCGGCALQHASDAFVAGWKTDIVRIALAAHGLPAPIRALHTSPAQSRRRAAFSGRRTKSGATVGFHGARSDVIQPVPNCLVLRPELTACIPALEAIVARAGTRKGEMDLTVTATETGLDLSVEGGRSLDHALTVWLANDAATKTFARITWHGDTVFTRERPVLTFCTAPVTPPPGSFLQATKEGESALLIAVTEAIGPNPKRTVDLFAGSGTFTLPLAQHAEIHAVEGEAEMLAALDHGWRHATGAKPVTTECRDLFRRPMTPDELARFGSAVIDPPRAGAEAQFKMLAKAGIPLIAAVSCNPVTFARDTAILTTAGYRIDWIDIVDQFRWSPHVELVAALTIA